jgi:drug/metabolite transporter (DMT)-like permease
MYNIACILLYVFIIGIHLFVLKLGSQFVTWQTMLLFTWIPAFSIVVFITVFSGKIVLNKYVLIIIAAGILAGIGNVFMYQVIKNNPVSKAFPLMSLVQIIPIVLAILFLSESITWTRVLAVIFAALTIVFLNL